MSASTRVLGGAARVTPVAAALLLWAEVAVAGDFPPVTESFPVDQDLGVGFCAGLSSLECGQVLGEGEFVRYKGDQTVWHQTIFTPSGTSGLLQLKIDLDVTGLGDTTGGIYLPDGETNKFRFPFHHLPFSTTVETTNVITAVDDPDGFFFIVHADYDVKVNASGETHVSTLAGLWSSECPVGTLYECGNGICEAGSLGEACTNCPSDCGACSCGDGCCQDNEDSSSCAADCTAPGAVCEEVSGPFGAGTCSDTNPDDCVCQGCLDDGVCTIDDDCTCADCAGDFVCSSTFCLTDGVCDVFSEGCDCPECASAAADCAP